MARSGVNGANLPSSSQPVWLADQPKTIWYCLVRFFLNDHEGESKIAHVDEKMVLFLYECGCLPLRLKQALIIPLPLTSYPKGTSPEQPSILENLPVASVSSSEHGHTPTMCQWKDPLVQTLLNVYENKLDLRVTSKSSVVEPGRLLERGAALRCYVPRLDWIPCTKPMNLSPWMISSWAAAIMPKLFMNWTNKTIEVWDLMLRLLEESRVSKLKESSRLLCGGSTECRLYKAWHWASLQRQRPPASISSVRCLVLKTQEAGLYWKDKKRRSFAGLARCGWTYLYNSGYFAVLLWFLTFQDMVSEISLPRAGLQKMAPAALARITRYPVDPLDWASMPKPTIYRRKSVAGQNGKTLPELLASLFSIVHPHRKSNLMAKILVWASKWCQTWIKSHFIVNENQR